MKGTFSDILESEYGQKPLDSSDLCRCPEVAVVDEFDDGFINKLRETFPAQAIDLKASLELLDCVLGYYIKPSYLYVCKYSGIV